MGVEAGVGETQTEQTEQTARSRAAHVGADTASDKVSPTTAASRSQDAQTSAGGPAHQDAQVLSVGLGASRGSLAGHAASGGRGRPAASLMRVGPSTGWMRLRRAASRTAMREQHASQWCRQPPGLTRRTGDQHDGGRQGGCSSGNCCNETRRQRAVGDEARRCCGWRRTQTATGRPHDVDPHGPSLSRSLDPRRSPSTMEALASPWRHPFCHRQRHVGLSILRQRLLPLRSSARRLDCLGFAHGHRPYKHKLKKPRHAAS